MRKFALSFATSSCNSRTLYHPPLPISLHHCHEGRTGKRLFFRSSLLQPTTEKRPQGYELTRNYLCTKSVFDDERKERIRTFTKGMPHYETTYFLEEEKMQTPPIATSSRAQEQDQQRQPRRLFLHTFESLNASTQDEVKRLLALKEEEEKSNGQNGNNNHYCLAVLTDDQKDGYGRGTKGRSWRSSKGNVFLSIGIPMQCISDRISPITLLPLQIGVFVAQLLSETVMALNQLQKQQKQLQQRLSSGISSSSMIDENGRLPNITVKWPNDVLVDGKKIAGTLIESFTTKTAVAAADESNTQPCCANKDWFIIGIGINVVQAPKLGQNDRVATSLQNYFDFPLRATCKTIENIDENNITATQLGIQLTHNFVDWVFDPNKNNHSTTCEEIVNNWMHWAKIDGQTPMYLRTDKSDDATITSRSESTTNNSSPNNYNDDTPKGEIIIPVKVNSYGQLVVRNPSTGKERLLTTDYLH